MTSKIDFPATAGNPAPAPNSPAPGDNPALRAARELDAYADQPYGDEAADFSQG